MGKRDRVCICCNEKYQYCPTCGNDRVKPTWMAEFCSEDCKNLWETATKYNMQMLNKADAKAAIEKLVLNAKSVYVECVQRDLAKILAEEPKAEPKVKAQKADMK